MFKLEDLPTDVVEKIFDLEFLTQYYSGDVMGKVILKKEYKDKTALPHKNDDNFGFFSKENLIETVRTNVVRR